MAKLLPPFLGRFPVDALKDCGGGGGAGFSRCGGGGGALVGGGGGTDDGGLIRCGGGGGRTDGCRMGPLPGLAPLGEEEKFPVARGGGGKGPRGGDGSGVFIKESGSVVLRGKVAKRLGGGGGGGEDISC